MSVIQRQSAVPATSITSADVSAASTWMLLINMPAMVTFYRGHRRTLCCLPGIISLIIMCIGINFRSLLFRRRMRLTGPRLGLNSRPQPLRASRSTAHGAQTTGLHRQAHYRTFSVTFLRKIIKTLLFISILKRPSTLSLIINFSQKLMHMVFLVLFLIGLRPFYMIGTCQSM